jgi:pilus assembly protein Flp/PilA
MTAFKQLLRREEGATAIEYGLIAALISIPCSVAFQNLGLNLANIFTTISNGMCA